MKFVGMIPKVGQFCCFDQASYIFPQNRILICSHSAPQNLKHSNIFSSIMTAFILTLITIISFLPFLILGSPVSKPQAHTAWPYSYPEPESCHGNCSWIHDPNVFFEDGVYWRFSTSGNIAVATAPSLEGPWDYKGALLHEGTKIRLRDDQDIWVSLIPLL